MMWISVAESSRRRARNGRRSVEAAASTADASTAPLAAPGSTADKGQDGVEAACARSRGGGVGCCWGAVIVR